MLPESGPTQRSRLFRRLGWFAAALFFLLAWVALINGQTGLESIGEIDWPVVGASLFILLLGQSVRGLMGWGTGGALGDPISPARSYRAWHLSQVAKYAPGGIWLFPARVVMYRDYGVERAIATAIVLIELVLIVATGVGLAAVGGATALVGTSGTIVALAAAALVVISVASPALWRFLASRGVKGADVVAARLGGGRLAGARLLAWPGTVAAVSWLLIGLGFHLLLVAVSPATTGWLQSAAIYAAAWVAGFLVVFAPAGLGVREAALAVGLTPVIGGPLSLAVAVGSRLWWLTAETVHVLIAAIWRRWGDS